MQVTELKNEKLSREYRITLQASDLETKIDHRLRELGRTVRRNGFRPGKIPMLILRREYGGRVLGEVLQEAVSDSTKQALDERGIRPAMQPKVELSPYQEGGDFEFKVAIEVLPEIGAIDYEGLSLEKLVTEVGDEEVEAALVRLSENTRTPVTIEESRPAVEGDILVIDFAGRIDGEYFEGGAGEDHQLELGAGKFIPGFEDQLIGSVVGEERVVCVSFPTDYGAVHLAGKAAEFAVKIKSLQELSNAMFDEELAENYGFESLEALRESVRTKIAEDYEMMSRSRLKQSLLDALAKKYQFDVPEPLVEEEFNAIWEQLQQELKKKPDSGKEASDKSEEEQRSEFQSIALRRVRLGLLLAEVGHSSGIDVSNDDLYRAVVNEAQRRSQQEGMAMMKYYQDPKNKEALDGLRGPIFEEKVVNYMLELAKPVERKVDAETLLREVGNSEDDSEAEMVKQEE